MSDNRKQVELLIEKSVKSEKSEDAIRFSQAACNAANAGACLANTEQGKK